jgi:hypothetical protein
MGKIPLDQAQCQRGKIVLDIIEAKALAAVQVIIQFAQHDNNKQILILKFWF